MGQDLGRQVEASDHRGATPETRADQEPANESLRCLKVRRPAKDTASAGWQPHRQSQGVARSPTPLSLTRQQFVGLPLNACFVSDLEERILRWQPTLWLHGHVHDSFDYWVGATRVVANPRGYAPQGVVENKAFAPELILEI